MRIYLTLLCLALSPLSYGNDLISGYKWREFPASVIKTASGQAQTQTEQSIQNQDPTDLSDEHNNKAAEPEFNPNKANLSCKQDKSHC